MQDEASGTATGMATAADCANCMSVVAGELPGVDLGVALTAELLCLLMRALRRWYHSAAAGESAQLISSL